jgi:nucleoid-associated protein YgaU
MAEALAKLEDWAQGQRESVAYELRTSPMGAMELEIPDIRPARRGWVMAGVFIGTAATLGALGYYVVERTREASEESARVAASAAAVVQAVDKQKLDELEKYSFGSPPASAQLDAAPPARSKKRPHR